jgi:hypothetical protein
MGYDIKRIYLDVLKFKLIDFDKDYYFRISKEFLITFFGN